MASTQAFREQKYQALMQAWRNAFDEYMDLRSRRANYAAAGQKGDSQLGYIATQLDEHIAEAKKRLDQTRQNAESYVARAEGGEPTPDYLQDDKPATRSTSSRSSSRSSTAKAAAS